LQTLLSLLILELSSNKRLKVKEKLAAKILFCEECGYVNKIDRQISNIHNSRKIKFSLISVWFV
jgi:hypothetical protein